MPLHLKCPSCGAVNRVAPAKIDQKPTCGRCKTPLGLPDAPVEVDDADLQALVRASPVPVLVDFWAPWCGPCRVVAPHLADLAKRQRGRLVVAKLNTDEHKQTAAELRIQAIPTLAVYKGGRLVDRVAGALMGPQLEQFALRHA